MTFGFQRLQVFLRGARLAEAEGPRDLRPGRRQAVGGDALTDEIEDGLLARGEVGGHGANFSTYPDVEMRPQYIQWLACRIACDG